MNKPSIQLKPRGIVRQIENLDEAQLRELANLLTIMHPLHLCKFKDAMNEMINESDRVRDLENQIKELIEG